MNRVGLLFKVLILSIFTLACSISYEGINFSDDPEELDRQKLSQEMTAIAEAQQEEPAVPLGDPAVIAETPKVDTPSSDIELPMESDTHSYSVQATNYDCICAVDGDVEVTFNYVGDTLEVFDGQGIPTVYTKEGENRYTRSFMGYYILDSDSGSTKVEEEKRVVIIFTDTGYSMEHYSGDSGSPCCIHEFTNK